MKLIVEALTGQPGVRSGGQPCDEIPLHTAVLVEIDEEMNRRIRRSAPKLPIELWPNLFVSRVHPIEPRFILKDNLNCTSADIRIV